MKTLMKAQIITLGIAIAISGCGVGMGGAPEIPYSIESYNMDGTKLIVNGFKNQADESTVNQEQYTLKADQRLLIRFESLSSHVGDIKNSWDNELHLRVVPADGTDAETVRQSVKLCPVIKNWMMLATWYNAYPFNKEGHWMTPGGDFDSSGCITGEVQNPDGTDPDASPTPAPSPVPTATPGPSWGIHYDHGVHPSPTPYGPGHPVKLDKPYVDFDIKHWFESNPVGRGVNYGFILVATAPVTIFGDRSDAYSPRIYWKMPKTYYTGDTQDSKPHDHYWSPERN